MKFWKKIRHANNNLEIKYKIEDEKNENDLDIFYFTSYIK